MKNHFKILILIAGLFNLLQQNGMTQTIVDLRNNEVRLDGLGPILFTPYRWFSNTPRRASLEFARNLNILGSFSLTAAIEYMEFNETFEGLWKMQNVYVGNPPIWEGGFIRNKQLSFLGGLRWSAGTSKLGGKTIFLFLEPRLGWSSRWGRKMAFLTDGSCCDYDVKEQGLAPRLRSGFKWQLTPLFAVELVGEAIYQKFLGAGKYRLRLWPQINMVFCF